METVNCYASGTLDRAALLRGDEQWLRDRLADPSSRFVPAIAARHLIDGQEQPRAVLLPLEAVRGLTQLQDAHLLGLRDPATAVFAIELPSTAETRLASLGSFRELREVGPLLSREDGALLAYARGLLYWHGRQRFCGICGSETGVRLGGHLRVCSNLECAAEHFPRTDPAVIMLVHDGGDRCLLGSQERWPKGMYSTLAGFVEPGESLEDAVRREVFEEAGVHLDEVRYHSSQPWPFPGSIMLGFTAVTSASTLRIDHDELEDARWFERRELRHALEAGDDTLRVPRLDSIARRLISDWVTSAPG